jgi:hypothetical protein
MTLSAHLIRTSDDEVIRTATVSLPDFATPRSLVYRLKRSLSVSHIRHTAHQDGDGMRINLIGTALHIETERIDLL